MYISNYQILFFVEIVKEGVKEPNDTPFLRDGTLKEPVFSTVKGMCTCK